MKQNTFFLFLFLTNLVELVEKGNNEAVYLVFRTNSLPSILLRFEVITLIILTHLRVQSSFPWFFFTRYELYGEYKIYTWIHRRRKLIHDKVEGKV